MARVTRSVRVEYTQTVSSIEWGMLVDYAAVCGHDFDHPTESVMVKRLLKEEGTSALNRAREYRTEELNRQPSE